MFPLQRPAHTARSSLAPARSLLASATVSFARARVGFLFNHDQTHQIAHSLPIALAMARERRECEVIIAVTTGRLEAELRRLIAAHGAEARLSVQRLHLSRRSAIASRIAAPFAPLGKVLIYGDNLEFFRNLDLLVVSEKTSLMLKTRPGLDGLRIIHTRHGAGDRAIGFDPQSAAFDHVLCAGEKIRRRLISDAHVPTGRISVTGYPKFDMAPRNAALPQGFDPAKPTVIYNPHPSPQLSSWYRHGRDVLAFFRRNPRWQLIFAPHVMLFERPFVFSIDRLRAARPGRIDRKYYEAPNIHIDTSSTALTDMSYVNAADIYLGDASSQVYEFLRKPRPCLFLNSHDADWKEDENFLFWRLGEVLSGPAGLGAALERAAAQHREQYSAVQERIFAETFDLTSEASSRRAARVIAGLIHSQQGLAA